MENRPPVCLNGALRGSDRRVNTSSSLPVTPPMTNMGVALRIASFQLKRAARKRVKLPVAGHQPHSAEPQTPGKSPDSRAGDGLWPLK